MICHIHYVQTNNFSTYLTKLVYVPPTILSEQKSFPFFSDLLNLKKDQIKGLLNTIQTTLRRINRLKTRITDHRYNKSHIKKGVYTRYIIKFLNVTGKFTPSLIFKTVQRETLNKLPTVRYILNDYPVNRIQVFLFFSEIIPVPVTYHYHVR